MMKNKVYNSDRRFDIINTALLILIGLMFVYPIWFVVIASLSSPAEIWSGNVVFLPKGFNLNGYKAIMKQAEIWIGYKNSLFYLAAGVIISLFLTTCAAYPLSRRDFKAAGFLMKIYTFTMFFSGGIVPLYLLVKSMHMMNTRWAVLLPSALSVYNLIIMRTYFQTAIPHELYEAASIDGCTNIKYVNSVVIPLSKPILAVIALYYGVARWNEFFNPLMFLTDRNKLPLTVFLREYLLQMQMSTDMLGGDARNAAEQLQMAEKLKYGIIIVSSIPMLIIYPFVQKYFVKGVMIGSIKG